MRNESFTPVILCFGPLAPISMHPQILWRDLREQGHIAVGVQGTRCLEAGLWKVHNQRVQRRRTCVAGVSLVRKHDVHEQHRILGKSCLFTAYKMLNFSGCQAKARVGYCRHKFSPMKISIFACMHALCATLAATLRDDVQAIRMHRGSKTGCRSMTPTWSLFMVSPELKPEKILLPCSSWSC